MARDIKGMKHRTLIGAITLALLLAASQSGASSWCAYGPDSKPDHPCEDDDDAVEAAAAKYRAQWMALSGVVSVDAEHSERGDYMALRVTVDPSSLIPAIKASLPTETDGFAVEVGPIATGLFLVPGVFDLGKSAPPSALEGSDDETARPPSAATDDDTDPFTDAMMDDETQEWMDLPGVEGIHAAQCGEHDCSPPEIAVEVQPSMIDSVRKQIPESKFGVAITIVPSR